jgi:hypothetical protein
MATALTKTTAPGAYAAAGVAVAMAAADSGAGNKFTASGKDLVIAYNSGASSHTVTITSVADQYGRLGTITAETIAAGAFRIYGPLPGAGWVQPDGTILISANHAEVLFGVIALPG